MYWIYVHFLYYLTLSYLVFLLKNIYYTSYSTKWMIFTHFPNIKFTHKWCKFNTIETKYEDDPTGFPNKQENRKKYLIPYKYLNVFFLLFPTWMTELWHISKQYHTSKKTLLKSHIIAMVCKNFCFHFS